LALSVTEVGELTATVVMGNVALVAPAGTVTVVGTVATDVWLLERATTAPPEAAAPLSVTVPVELLLPPTVGGFAVSEARVTVGCRTVREALRVLPPNEAEIATDVVELI
jgi:hypothetical protein